MFGPQRPDRRAPFAVRKVGSRWHVYARWTITGPSGLPMTYGEDDLGTAYSSWEHAMFVATTPPAMPRVP